MDSERGGCCHLSRDRVAQALGKTTVEQIFEIVSAHRPARKILAALGTEIFYATPDQIGGGANLRFNVGVILDLTEHHHLLFSVGRGIVGESVFQGYAAYQLTL